MTIEALITLDKIAHGIPSDCNECPIALALMEHGFDGVQVLGRGFKFYKDGNRFRGLLPQKARKFIADFDAKRRVEPDIFILKAYAART
jgi:hypothetical protein